VTHGSESDQFSVFLLRGFDDAVVERAMRKASPGDWWSLGGAEAIEVGPVDIRLSDSNLARATAAFTVPEVPPATYHLMLCDAGCDEPLAEVVPTEGFTVVADPATAKLARRVDRLERRSMRQAERLGAARGEIAVARLATRNARAEIEHLEAVSEPRRSRPATAWTYAGWLVAGALAVFVVARR
jgi:hypothetical protein